MSIWKRIEKLNHEAKEAAFKQIETKYISMHIFACRFITKIIHSLVSKLNMYTLSKERKNKHIRFNFLKKYTALVDYCIITWIKVFIWNRVFFSFNLLQNDMNIWIHYRNVIRQLGIIDVISKGGRSRKSMFIFPI